MPRHYVMCSVAAEDANLRPLQCKWTTAVSRQQCYRHLSMTHIHELVLLYDAIKFVQVKKPGRNRYDLGKDVRSSGDRNPEPLREASQ